MVLKKHWFKISLLMILAIAGALCISSLWSYGGKVQTTQNKIVAQEFVPNGNHSIGEKMGPPNSNQSFQRGAVHNQKDSQAGNYNTQIVIYAGVFLLLSLLAYYFIIHKKMSVKIRNETWIMLTVLTVGFLLRIFLATIINGHPYDLNTFKNWATSAASNLSQFYQGRNSSDYPPLYIYVLYFIGKFGSISIINPYFSLLLKLPSIIADIATSFLIYKLAKRYFSLGISLLLSAFYVFNPAVFINSAVWGQVDSFFTLLVVSAVVLLTEKKIGWASVLFTSAVLMKPQGIIFLPVVFFELIRQRNLKSWLKVLGSGLLTAIIVVFPFAWKEGWMWIFKLFAGTVGEYPYASVNAFNFFALLGKNYVQDSTTLLVFSYHTWGMIFIVLITALAWFLYYKGKNRALAPAIALLLIDGVFTFSCCMHERYLFPAVALSILAFIYLRDKRLLLLAVGLSSTVYINTHYVLFEALKGGHSIVYGPILIMTSILNILCFIYLIKVLYDLTFRKRIKCRT